ncbi:hypothetical protein JG687_00017302 [Phytophthora cactorum]|uniref:Uncharacterized protein n=1 Tax=Phytophthora cactorum TaxID=29920 RepID=A0A8T1TQ85_9STRA|nr:hypothetical protein JG687_00017302 [Phytophthora cactorum]
MFDIVYNGMLSTKAVASAVANIVRRQQKRFYSIRSRVCVPKSKSWVCRMRTMFLCCRQLRLSTSPTMHAWIRKYLKNCG